MTNIQTTTATEATTAILSSYEVFERAITPLQNIMDAAYAKWDNGQDMEEWFQALDENEQIAVAIGKFNQQVTNGGFYQWWDNGYAVAMYASLIKGLEMMLDLNLSTASTVLDLVEDFYNVVEGYLDEQDFRDNVLGQLSWGCECQPEQDEDGEEIEVDAYTCTCGYYEQEEKSEGLMDEMAPLDNSYYEIDKLFVYEAVVLTNIKLKK